MTITLPTAPPAPASHRQPMSQIKFTLIISTILGVALAAIIVACMSATAHQPHVTGHGRYLAALDQPTPAPQGATRVFDAQKMATAIESSTEGQQAGLKNITCPADEPVAVGREFDCQAGSTTIHIKVNSADGDYTWTPER